MKYQGCMTLLLFTGQRKRRGSHKDRKCSHFDTKHVDNLQLLFSPKPPDSSAHCRWEFLVQRSVGLRLLCIEDVDLGSGPLEWLCKGLRTHQVGRTMGQGMGEDGWIEQDCYMFHMFI